MPRPLWLGIKDNSFWGHNHTALNSYSATLHGDTAFVGALYDDDKGANSGSVYHWGRDATTGTWAQVAKLTATDGAAGDDSHALGFQDAGDPGVHAHNRTRRHTMASGGPTGFSTYTRVCMVPRSHQ